MIEIIPNWHPILVHFTIALFATATVLFFVGTIFSKETLLKTAHINLWIGAAITILTLLAGWDAYNTVNHDSSSHAAMTDHRNWALATAALFFFITFWSLFTFRRTAKVGVLFLALIAIASGLLATTGYKGGEAVYRYGLGVMSMPTVSGDGGHGSHGHNDVNKEAKDSHEHMQKSVDNDDVPKIKKDVLEDHSKHMRQQRKLVASIFNSVPIWHLESHPWMCVKI
jgi:uncharacterized membrane protein